MSSQEWTLHLAAALRARCLPPPEFAALMESSASRSGYHRMSALHALQRLGNAAALPAFIIRANDWVPPLREAAVEAINSLTKPENAAAFALCLPLFHNLRACRRADHGPLLDRVTTFLCRPENAAAVLAGIRDDEPRIARACLRLAMAERLAPAAALVQAALTQRDPMTRALVAPLLTQLAGDERRAALAAIRHDRSLPLRLAALRLELAESPAAVDLPAHLFDRYVAVRQLAANRLREQGIDPAPFFVQVLTDGTDARRLRIALWGLGEYGGRDDVASIRRYLDHPVAALRREALNALARRDGEGLRAAVLDALGDAELPVALQAARIAVHLCLHFDAAELLPLLANPARAGLLLGAQRLSNKWERLLMLLQVHATTAADRGLFEHGLNQWELGFNRSFVAMSAIQRAQLSDTLAQQRETLQATLGPHGLDRLLHLLR